MRGKGFGKALSGRGKKAREAPFFARQCINNALYGVATIKEENIPVSEWDQIRRRRALFYAAVHRRIIVTPVAPEGGDDRVVCRQAPILMPIASRIGTCVVIRRIRILVEDEAAIVHPG